MRPELMLLPIGLHRQVMFLKFPPTAMTPVTAVASITNHKLQVILLRKASLCMDMARTAMYPHKPAMECLPQRMVTRECMAAWSNPKCSCLRVIFHMPRLGLVTRVKCLAQASLAITSRLELGVWWVVQVMSRTA